MRLAIYGSGGVGGYFGGRLAQAGEDVTFIARGEHLDALRTKGLKVDSINGDFHLNSVETTDKPEEVGEVELILVAVKAWQIRDVAEAMRPMVGGNTAIIPLLNGVEAADEIANVLGAKHVLPGLCGLMSAKIGAGHIKHGGADPFIKFGEMDNRESERVENIRAVFENADGVTVIVPPDIQIALWQKFLFITPASGVGAVTRAPFGIVRTNEGTRQMVAQAMQEVVKVAQGLGIGLSVEMINKSLEFLDNMPPQGSTSMQRDVMAGRHSELEAHSGALVRLGEKAGVDTPVNSFIYHCLLPMDLRARGELQFD